MQVIIQIQVLQWTIDQNTNTDSIFVDYYEYSSFTQHQGFSNTNTAQGKN